MKRSNFLFTAQTSSLHQLPLTQSPRLLKQVQRVPTGHPVVCLCDLCGSMDHCRLSEMLYEYSGMCLNFWPHTQHTDGRPGVPCGHTEFAQKTGTGLVIVCGLGSRKHTTSDHGIRTCLANTFLVVFASGLLMFQGLSPPRS